MDDYTSCIRKYLWKMEVPLKIRIFMWFLHCWVLLTKDNFANRNWHGCKKYCFYNQDESIQHLFLVCPLAKVVFRIVHLLFNIIPPKNRTNLFRDWLAGVVKKIECKFEWEFALYFGLYRMWGTTISFPRQKLFSSCRLYLWLPIEFICDLSYNQWRSVSIWIVSACG
jgi:hypothetical protein